MNNVSSKNKPWWSEEYGFFGDFYIQGDDSKEGYLINKKQSLAERTKEEASGIIKLLNLEKGSKVLDCPCGYGRHSIELSKKGMIVTGLDINSVHLEKAKEEASKQNLDIDFEKENMLELGYDDKFDAIINMFYSFGFFDTDEENEKVLQNFFNSLKAEGKFLMHTDVNVPTIISKQYKEDETRNLKDGKTLRIIDKYNEEMKRIEGKWIIKDELGRETERDYSVRVYTKEEFIELCKKIGFKKCEAFSDWKGTPYSTDSEDMIIVATK